MGTDDTPLGKNSSIYDTDILSTKEAGYITHVVTDTQQIIQACRVGVCDDRANHHADTTAEGNKSVPHRYTFVIHNHASFQYADGAVILYSNGK
jgi:hypothetical protein